MWLLHTLCTCTAGGQASYMYAVSVKRLRHCGTIPAARVAAGGDNGEGAAAAVALLLQEAADKRWGASNGLEISGRFVAHMKLVVNFTYLGVNESMCFFVCSIILCLGTDHPGATAPAAKICCFCPAFLDALGVENAGSECACSVPFRGQRHSRDLI